MRRLSGNGPHLAWRAEPPGFSRVAAGALDLRWEHQGPAVVASGKASPHASCSGGLSGFLSRRCWGLRPCVESGPEPEDSSPVLTWILAYFWSLPSLRQSSARVGSCTCAFLPSCSSSVTLPFTWIKGSVVLLRGFPTRLSHSAVPRATVV